jgi:Fe-S cluster assembly scaffold protein SufB
VQNIKLHSAAARSPGEFYSIAIANSMQADTGKMIHLGKRTKSRIVSKTSLLAGADALPRPVSMHPMAKESAQYTR